MGDKHPMEFIFDAIKKLIELPGTRSRRRWGVFRARAKSYQRSVLTAMPFVCVFIFI